MCYICDAINCRRGQLGRVKRKLGGGRRRGPWLSNPQLQNLTLRTCSLKRLVGKELEVVREVERLRLHIVVLASMQSLGSQPSILQRGRTPLHSGVAPYGRCRAGVGIFAHRIAACTLVCTPVDQMVASLHLFGGGVITVFV